MSPFSYGESRSQRKERERREQAAADLEREQDELDELIIEAGDVTYQADLLAHRLAYGLVDVDEARQFLADTDTTANPFIDLAFLEHTVIMTEMTKNAVGTV